MGHSHTSMDTHSFAAGFVSAAILFMIPILLVPSMRAMYVDPVYYDMQVHDVDTDGVNDAYDANFGPASFSSFGTVDTMVNTAAGGGVCEDGVDNDRDGPVDTLDPDCDRGGSSSSSSRPTEICTDGVDNDGDGMVDMLDTDCM